MKKILLSAMILSFVGLEAAEAHRRDQRRERAQQERIRDGVQDGELTRKEAKKLRKGQRRIDHMQNKAMEDGVITEKEKWKIEKAQDRQNKLIYKEKNDEQDRGRQNGASHLAPGQTNERGEDSENSH